MTPTEHEMTVAVHAAARTLYATLSDAPPFDDLPANERLSLRESVLTLVVAALEAVPDRAPSTLRAFRPKCPQHGIPDCSPLLNGCRLPEYLRNQLDEHARKLEEVTR